MVHAGMQEGLKGYGCAQCMRDGRKCFKRERLQTPSTSHRAKVSKTGFVYFAQTNTEHYWKHV